MLMLCWPVRIQMDNLSVCSWDYEKTGTNFLSSHEHLLLSEEQPDEITERSCFTMIGVTAFNMGSIKPRSPKFFIDMNINWKAKHWEPARLKRSSLVNVMIMSWCDAVVYRSNHLLWPICKDSYYFMTCSNSSPLVLLSPDHLFNLSFVNIKSLSVQYLYK